ncbi:MAG TPA: LEA type 2 family protein [Steroidobacteraceae bacterium]|nr:LEA type 2 family protein [Steroidobacteraceae bacterium]
MLALLSGCAATRLEMPRLQVIDVSLLGGDLLQQQLRLRMRVQNPNDVALPVRGITYQVQLAGETFADGESERDFVIPALGETEFNVDVTANAAAAVLRLLGSRDRGNPQYRVLGKVKLAKGLIRTIPFDHSGELKLR